jgi:hypothetical protein
MPAPLVAAIGKALTLANEDGPWSYLGWTLQGWEGEGNFLHYIRLRIWLAGGIRNEVGAEVLEKLEDADETPWPKVREALVFARRTS